MNDSLCSIWNSHTRVKTSALIIPDGCRDIIMKRIDGEQPYCFVSPLFDHTETIVIEENTSLIGFRMKPGVHISEKELLKAVTKKSCQTEDIHSLLDDFTNINHATEEALNCLSNHVNSVKQAATTLGVSTRTLQRLIYNNTDRTPNYWFQLARARRTARDLCKPIPLVNIAETHGFSDQSHMSREIKRWFSISPSEIINRPDMVRQLTDEGYN